MSSKEICKTHTTDDDDDDDDDEDDQKDLGLANSHS